MVYLGSYNSSGQLFLDDEPLGEGEIHLRVSKRRVLTDARGTLWANPKILFKITNNRGKPRIETPDGHSISFFISSYRLQGESADIEISGPVPGY